ncbi:MAG: undecaprenyl-diphosphatase [Acidobacteria bacterium RIFCSPLOWO2_02_FULL_68_18]|nr:MAG: undecaprenyl-diphosphatase [Acidobacteria bacterium RIFCSPLOWO2_02_FULL_68_18]OFW51883.1 MAG: undecaprenyl-diphosphatase [Acidobacteria bacterium RIFCSPLOWO2_12_FULL_68_19]
MTYLVAALLGVIQGLTEFLPISSTAHLLVAGRLLGYEDPAFTVMIQLGSVLAIMWLYRAKIASVVSGIPSDRDARRFALMLAVATVPALLGGLAFGDFIQAVLFRSLQVIGTALIAGGIVMLVLERFRPAPSVLDAGHTPLGRAFAIGLCQMLALVPGVSRSGATIVGGLLMRLDRPAAAEFSFFLAMPTMAAAFAYQVMQVGGELAPERAIEIAIGFLAAFLSAALIVRPFLLFVRRSGFAPFAWYRIAFGIGVLMSVPAG